MTTLVAVAEPPVLPTYLPDVGGDARVAVVALLCGLCGLVLAAVTRSRGRK